MFIRYKTVDMDDKKETNKIKKLEDFFRKPSTSVYQTVYQKANSSMISTPIIKSDL